MADSAAELEASLTPSSVPTKQEHIAHDNEHEGTTTKKKPESGAHGLRQEVMSALTQIFKDLNASKDGEKKADGDSRDSQSTSQSTSPSMVPEIRKVDFEHFKNRFKEEDGQYIVEALVAGSNLAQAVRVEAFRRNGIRVAPEAALESGTANITMFPPDSTIQRVRIQSKAILNYLAKSLAEASELTDTRTFLYPFRPLIHSYESMCQVLRLLTQHCTDFTDTTTEKHDQEPKTHDSGPLGEPKGVGPEGGANRNDSTAVGNDALGSDAPTIMTLDPGFDTAEALAEIKAYVTFVGNDLLPLLDKYSGVSRQTVSFDDLWLLFSPGEYVVVPTGPQSIWKRERNIFRVQDEEVEEKTNPSQRLWRLFGVSTPNRDPNFTSTQPAKILPSKNQAESFDAITDSANACFYLHCYHIDFDEYKGRPVTRKIRIEPFKGEISIKSLPAYPLRYVEDVHKLQSDLKFQGQRFRQLRDTQHLFYKGWSMAHHPDGRPMLRNNLFVWEIGNVQPQYIESEVIIDFEETVNDQPQWAPSFKPPEPEAGVWSHNNDNFEIKCWTDYSRNELKSQQNDLVQTGDGVAMLQRKTAIENDGFLTRSKGSRSGEDESEDVLGEEDLMLLPKRLFAYSLRDRCYAALDLDLISTLPQQHGVFEQLKIPRTTKDLIRSLVDEHFEKKRIEDLMDGDEKEVMTQDLIGGKGKGLTILLHGVPGVGKTATAEAVALESRKPLFSLNPGDIGASADDVNRNLRRFFRLANKWNCVLLLDEADAFLSQRSTFDTNRNAMVSVFLQALEYYNGILFLTTNRVGQMDEAFQSRIHLKLYYQPLNEKQTEQIFQANIQKLRDNDAIRRRINKMPELEIDEEKIMSFATRPFRATGNIGTAASSPAQWNGRQIRNAFHLASSLAYRSMAEELARSAGEQPTGSSKQSSVVLDDSQFQTVVKTMQAFDQYIEKTKGFSAADLAFMTGNRADFWRDLDLRDTQHRQGYTAADSDASNLFYRDDASGLRDFQQRSSQTRRGVYTPEASASRSDMSFHQEDPYASQPYGAHFEGRRASQVPRRTPDPNHGLATDQEWSRQHPGYAGRMHPQPGFHDQPAVRNPARPRGEFGYEDRYEGPTVESGHTRRGGPPQRFRHEQNDADEGVDDYN